MLHFANLIIPALIVLPSLTSLVWPPRNAPPPEDKREQWLLQAAEQVGGWFCMPSRFWSAV